MTWKAIYMPSSQNPPPSKGGFQTEEEAWKWIEDNWICKDCRKEIAAFDRGEEDDPDNGKFVSAFPPCMCEWHVYDEEEEIKEVFKEYYSDELLEAKIKQTGIVNLDEIIYSAFALGYIHKEENEE